MKITFSILMISLCAAIGYGQGTIVAESSRPVDNKVVKTAPYSAEAISTTTQTLADGNKVTRTTTSRIYRDSEGRYRREDKAKEVGVGGAVVEVPESIVIADPIAGYRWALNTKDNTAMATKMRVSSEAARTTGGGGGGFVSMGSGGGTGTSTRAVVKEGSPEIRTSTTGGGAGGTFVTRPSGTEPSAAGGAGAGSGAVVTRSIAPTTGGGGMGAGPAAGAAKRETRTESLGTRTIEGVETEGTRTIITIPAGAMGNDQPIESVYDRWYSKELDVVVFSRSTSPTSGEQSYRLTNIKRENPPLSLFAPPADYKIVEQTENRMVAPTTAPVKKPDNL